MAMLLILGLVAVVAAFAAVTGIKPKGTEHVARTRLMGVARIILLILILLLGYGAYRMYSHA